MSSAYYTSAEVVAVVALWLSAGAIAAFIRVHFAEKYGARVHWTTVLVDVVVGPYSFVTVIRVISNVKALHKENLFEPTKPLSDNNPNWPLPPPPAR